MILDFQKFNIIKLLTKTNKRIIENIKIITLQNLSKYMGIGDWGLGIGDWGFGPIPNPQSPIPNPQSPYLPSIYYKQI